MPAPELEAMVVSAIRRHLQGHGTDAKPVPETDRELIERHLLRATLSATEVTLHLRPDGSGSDSAAGARATGPAASKALISSVIPPTCSRQ
jgi:hypothetical protein